MQRWLDLNEPRLRQWEEVLRMHQDDSIEDGTICTLAPLAAPQSGVGFALTTRKTLTPGEEPFVDIAREILQ